MNKTAYKTFLATIASGLAMWVVAGLWHNLVLPAVNSSAEAHHEGLIEMLIAYLILAGLMTYFYTTARKDRVFAAGLLTGVLVGFLWVFPHGLTMAGAHQTPILTEMKNAIWHCFEQGVGGVIIALIKRKEGFVSA